MSDLCAMIEDVSDSLENGTKKTAGRYHCVWALQIESDRIAAKLCSYRLVHDRLGRFAFIQSNSIFVSDLNFNLNPENDTNNPTLDYMWIVSENGFYNATETVTLFWNSKNEPPRSYDLGMHIWSCTVNADILANQLPVFGSIEICNFSRPHMKRAHSSQTLSLKKCIEAII